MIEPPRPPKAPHQASPHQRLRLVGISFSFDGELILFCERWALHYCYTLYSIVAEQHLELYNQPNG
jgi:hypothetical protein